jgi:hypothetical protein
MRQVLVEAAEEVTFVVELLEEEEEAEEVDS